IKEMCADLTSFGEGRTLDDDGNILLRFDNGARGVLHASQIAAGEVNDLNIRVHGEKGGLEWHQHTPDVLTVKWLDQPDQVYRAGGDRAYLGESAMAHVRTPAGHPEGYLEGFANIYRNFAMTLRARMQGQEPDPQHLDFPDIDDGIRGMAFIENAVASSKSEQKWYPFTI
ncbi:MAG: Gfo/Idh/MocA family oxidoreductase, partial [Bacteroidota bacterium]